MSKTIHILHSIAGLNISSGGTSRVAVDFTDALARQSLVDVTLLSQSSKGEALVPSSSERIRRVVVSSESNVALRSGLLLNAVIRRLTSTDRIDILHSHGLWMPANHWTTLAAVRQCIPLIVQPHGMLEPWALNYKAWKKRLAMALFQRRDLETAKVLVATSSVEYQNIRKLGLRQPIAVIPNGVKLDLPIKGKTPPDADRKVRTALFLSRVHPKKGLLNFVEAWARLRPLNWRLRIAGPNEGRHLNEVMDAAHQHGIEDSVDYVGEVDGERKSATYNDADVFVLPTYSENFGVVVAEALAHGVPVITTRGAPWADLETHRCGWWVEIGVAPLVSALRDAMALSDEERWAMGERGREYVRRYDWDDIAKQTIDVYRWVLEQGAKPDCVRMD